MTRKELIDLLNSIQPGLAELFEERISIGIDLYKLYKNLQRDGMEYYFIHAGMVWSDTEEGQDFWSDISKKFVFKYMELHPESKKETI